MFSQGPTNLAYQGTHLSCFFSHKQKKHNLTGCVTANEEHIFVINDTCFYQKMCSLPVKAFITVAGFPIRVGGFWLAANCIGLISIRSRDKRGNRAPYLIIWMTNINHQSMFWSFFQGSAISSWTLNIIIVVLFIQYTIQNQMMKPKCEANQQSSTESLW